MRREAYPIIDRERFDRNHKSHKPKDLKRILYSEASEDWVTWTVFRLLERCTRSTWWSHIVNLARTENQRLTLPAGWEETPKVCLWHCVPSPSGYEMASRDRMRRSNDEAWVKRSNNSRPVEGQSEIEVILQNKVLVVFAEAKLGSDISLTTTYDPDRNQIVRNIDCLLDQVNDRVPMFWMLVREDNQARSYVRLLNEYRDQPSVLIAKLGHHDAERVRTLAGNLALLLWKDIVSQIAEALPSDDGKIASITNELLSRLHVPRPRRPYLHSSPGKGQTEMRAASQPMQAENTNKPADGELQRISELRDCSISLHSPNAYFRADDDKLSNPYKRKFLRNPPVSAAVYARRGHL